MSDEGAVPPVETGLDRLDLAALVAGYASRRQGWDPATEAADVTVVRAEVLRQGRPGLLDVVARVGDRIVHVPLGLRAPDDAGAFRPDGEDPVLGTLRDGDGEAVAFDALRDAETTALLVEAVSGRKAEPSLVRPVRVDDTAVTMAVDQDVAFTVWNTLVEGPRPETEVVLALDEAGFNHLAAPLGLWRRPPWDLGLLQEYLPGASTGSALALTSVRDLYASGGPPEMAGGDFGAEAHRLGTTAARMHLALEHAFGRRQVGLETYAAGVEAALAARQPNHAERPEVLALLGELRSLPGAGDAIRTHGDFHLGRVWRTEQGWYVGDFSPGGVPPAAATGPPPPAHVDENGVVYRTPLADVADMMWSFARVAAVAAEERDPSGRDGLEELAEAWEQRNRRAFLAGYLGVPGITRLVPAGREVVRVLVAVLELERGSRLVA